MRLPRRIKKRGPLKESSKGAAPCSRYCSIGYPECEPEDTDISLIREVARALARRLPLELVQTIFDMAAVRTLWILPGTEVGSSEDGSESDAAHWGYDASRFKLWQFARPDSTLWHDPDGRWSRAILDFSVFFFAKDGRRHVEWLSGGETGKSLWVHRDESPAWLQQWWQAQQPGTWVTPKADKAVRCMRAAEWLDCVHFRLWMWRPDRELFDLSNNATLNLKLFTRLDVADLLHKDKSGALPVRARRSFRPLAFMAKVLGLRRFRPPKRDMRRGQLIQA